ncbi:MAG: hypothetical protein PHR92_16340 [Lachnospiraceae bacterium]|nr:hypothetical protein [Lachnospiraceae bacterium]
MSKKQYYFPPKAKPFKKTVELKKTPTDITVGDDVKAELMKLAEEMVAKRESERSAEDLNNFMAFALEALNRLGWTGKTRLNRFLAALTEVSSEAVDASDPAAYADEIKERMTAKGVVAFMKNDDATPQLEDTGNEKPV